MQLTTENNDVFINLWNENKPDGFVHPMRKGVADIIFYALELAEYTVNFENDVLSLYDNQTNEDLGNRSLKDIFDKAYSICDTDYPDDTTSRTFGFNILSIFKNEELSPIEYKKEIRETLYKFYQTEKYFNTDEFLFNNIDYTTKNWVEIDNTYYEFEETQNMLSIGDSIVDLEDIYGENHFPDEAITDGKIKIFDSDSSCIDYLCEKHNLKDFEEVQDILMRDFDYPTKEVVEKVLPDFDNEQIKLLADIIEDQEINLEYITPLTFENIYFEIDESKLTDFEIETLDEIKKQLLKPTVEIFKQSFDSFIMSLSEAASKSIQTDIENIKAKALYVFNVDNNEYTIVSKRDSENPFMVHKYYPENETGGIHHGSYDIDTYESAEKIAANRLINEQKEKYELINFIAGTREEDFNLELKNELFSVFEYLNKYSLNEEDQIELIDVKAYQYEGPSGKLKVLVEYNGNCREDDLFNLLHDDEENGQDGHDYEINGYKIDLNPIKAEKSGTISEYLAMLKNVEEKWPEVNKLINEQKENVMYKKKHTKDSTGVEQWSDYDNKGNVIHYKNSDGLETWNEYDDKGNAIYYKDNVGYERWSEYDNKGNVIHYKNSNGYESWYEYDDKGNEIHFKNSDGLETWNEYDDKGNVIHFKNSNSYESWNEDKGNVIHFKDSNGYESWNEYDDKGNVIHYKDSEGLETWNEYDDKGNVIHFKNSDGFEYWNEYDDKDNVIHFKDSNGYERWYEYDDKGNEIHFKDSEGLETWNEYDDKGNVIHSKNSKGFELWSTVEYVSKEQYLQEKNNSQIETKYTKADINDLQSFFFPYPQLSESLCYQILDDFELYQIPLFKDSDGNIYQREMNTDLAEGDESDYHLLTQDGIIDQEYNWLIDRKYTSEDEIDLQKELEDIKKFEENPKSYYKSIFKVALEKEIEKVKKEINEGNVKDVIEKNILEIAEEKIGSHAVPEEIIGWYISEDEKNYFENWKNSGNFPDYKEALDSMFAYVYEHDTTKQNLRYVSELNETTQNKLKTLLQEHFEKEGLSEEEINTAIQNAIDSKIDDLNQLMESNEKIKSLFTNEKEWQQAVYEWNERRQGTNSEFKSIGTLIEVDSSDEQQIESLRKNTKDFNIDQKEAKALLSMVNYDSSSFEFMFDIDNGNFVEIDKKNKKIIDVATSKNILGYLTNEIKYIIKEEVSESFTVEELFNANVLNNILEYINKEPRYFQDLNKVEKEAVISGYWEAPDPDMYEKVVEEFYYKKGLKEPEPGLAEYPGDEWVSNYLSDNKINFNTEYWNSIFEVVNRQENAFEVAKKYFTEIDSSKEYTEAQKSDFVTKLFNQLKQGWDEYDNQPPSYKELEILIKGMDAFEYGEDSLSFIRPDADDIENGFDNGWDFKEVCKGYAEFADGYNESNVICRLDDMMIFDSDSDAAIQAKKDGYQFLEVGKDIIFPEEMLNDDIEYRNYIDTSENRTILKDFLRLNCRIIEKGYRITTQIDFEGKNKSELYSKIAKFFEQNKYSSVERSFEDSELAEEFYKWRSANYSILFPPQGYHHVTRDFGVVTPENDLYFAYEKQKEENQVKEPVQKLNKAESLTFGQFNSETNELKLIKEAYFKELVIDEKDASKNKVILGFKENDQEQLLEMGEVEYKNLLNAFGFSKEQQENTLEINKYKTFAEKKTEVVFDMIKSDYLGGTLFSDNELIGYLIGLKKSNNYHHYLDELLFESLEQSDESLFSNVVDAGADLTWRREENGEPINILHYAAADNLDIAIKKIIEKTKSLEVDDYINLFSEENFEGRTPLEIAISNSGGQYFESTKLLIDAMDDEGFSGVNDLLIEDKLGNKVLYTSKDNLDCVSILCFDKNNNIISADTESLVDEKSLGEIVSQDLIYQTNNDFIKGNIELNRSSKLISELKEVPQKLWDDEINIKLLKTLPEAGFFNSKKDLYDFDSILALEKIKKSLFSDFDNQKESLLQGLYTKKEFVDSIKEKELNLEELNNFEIGEFVECLENKYFRTELAALCFDKKINELFDTISPRPNEMGMYKNNDYTCLSLKISAASNNRPITEGEAEIILKYIQYENFNFYESMNNELCMLDVSEDFTGDGKIMTPEKIIDMAYQMMVKARDEEYSIYDVKDEEVFNDLRNKFGSIEEQQIESSKDEELKKQETSVIEQFFTKLKDSICDNAKLEDVLKSAASVLQTFSDTEKKEISQYLRNKDASLGNSENGLSSILEIKEPGQKKKRSKADDDTRGR